MTDPEVPLPDEVDLPCQQVTCDKIAGDGTSKVEEGLVKMGRTCFVA